MRRATILFAVSVLGCNSILAATQEAQFQEILDAAVQEGHRAVSAHVSWDNGSWSGVAGATSGES